MHTHESLDMPLGVQTIVGLAAERSRQAGEAARHEAGCRAVPAAVKQALEAAERDWQARAAKDVAAVQQAVRACLSYPVLVARQQGTSRILDHTKLTSM
jgi:hypothetical protein